METAQPAVPAIYQALKSINEKVGAILKSRENTQQKYKFRGIDEVYNEVHPLFAEHAILLNTRVLDRRTTEFKNGAGNRSVWVEEFVEVDFISCADASKHTYGPVWVEGIDMSDKASNKCLSAGQKYAVLQTFTIPTKDMIDDGDRETIERGERVEYDRGQEPRRQQRDDRDRGGRDRDRNERDRNERRPDNARTGWDRLSGDGANDTRETDDRRASQPPPEERREPSARLPDDNEKCIPADICERVRDLSPVPWSEQTDTQLLDQEQKLRTYSQGAKDPVFRARLAILATFAERERQARRQAPQQQAAGGAS